MTTIFGYAFNENQRNNNTKNKTNDNQNGSNNGNAKNEREFRSVVLAIVDVVVGVVVVVKQKYFGIRETELTNANCLCCVLCENCWLALNFARKKKHIYSKRKKKKIETLNDFAQSLTICAQFENESSECAHGWLFCCGPYGDFLFVCAYCLLQMF